MQKFIQKDDSYSKLMLTEGAETIVDEDSNYEMKLPDWADEKKIKMAQRFVLLNLNALVRAVFYGLMAVIPVESLTQVLIFTKQSSTPALAYRRFKANALHLRLWYQHEIKPGTIAWESLDTVRRMHAVVNKRSTKAGIGIVSQKDMAITQFLFMGFPVLMPNMFGVVGTHEQFDAFNHLWRLLGFLLGTEDRFNACGATVEETQSRLQSIVEDMLIPGWKDPFPGSMPYMYVAYDGVRTANPTIHYESMVFAIKRAIGLPGCHLFDAESPDSNGQNEKVFDKLSFYTKLHVLLEVLIYEHLSQIFIFRWIFNIGRILISFIELYPILAIYRFGKKYAFLEIMKSKRK